MIKSYKKEEFNRPVKMRRGKLFKDSGPTWESLRVLFIGLVLLPQENTGSCNGTIAGKSRDWFWGPSAVPLLKLASQCVRDNFAAKAQVKPGDDLKTRKDFQPTT